MATTGYVNGKLIGLYIGGTLVSYGTGCTISGSTNLINVSNKDSSGHREILPDEDQATINFNGVMRFDATYGVDDIIDAWKNKTAVTAKISTEVSGDMYLEASGYIENWELTADYGNRAEFSFSIAVNGEVTKSTVT